MNSLKQEEIQIQIDILLNRDLELLDPEERTVERWLQLLGDDAEFNQSKSKLIELQNSLKDINSSDSSN